jgi:hypothetical protein
MGLIMLLSLPLALTLLCFFVVLITVMVILFIGTLVAYSGVKNFGAIGVLFIINTFGIGIFIGIFVGLKFSIMAAF